MNDYVVFWNNGTARRDFTDGTSAVDWTLKELDSWRSTGAKGSPLYKLLYNPRGETLWTGQFLNGGIVQVFTDNGEYLNRTGA